MVNSLPCQVGVTPRNPGGIEPSTLVNSPPGQVRAAPLQLINTPLVPRKVTSSVFSWVPFSTSPIVAPVSLLPSSMSVLVPITDIAPPVTSPMSCTVPASASNCVTPVPSPSPSVPVSNLIAHGPSSVMSPPCSLASGAASVPLNTTQAMSHEQPMALPVGSDHPRSTFIEEVDD